jgi:hypothetical protein
MKSQRSLLALLSDAVDIEQVLLDFPDLYEQIALEDEDD